MTFLEEYDAAPAGVRHSLAHGWLYTEPLRFAAEMRESRPIIDTGQAILISKYADVMEVLRQPLVFTVDFNKAKMGDYMLAFDKTPMNTRDKSVMRSMLNRDDLPHVRDLVGVLTDKVLDTSGGSIDLVPAVGRSVPAGIVSQYFGFAGSNESLIRWSRAAQYDTFFNQPFDNRPDAEAIHQENVEGNGEMKQALIQLVKDRAEELQQSPEMDDILSRMLKTRFPESVGFGLERIVVNTGGLLIGAVETTSMAIVNVMEQLLLRPDAHREAREAAESGDNTHFDPYVWEALRFKPFQPNFYRKASHEHVVAKGTGRDFTVPEGAAVLPMTQSATFDVDFVDHPDEFRTDRPDETYELLFGTGHHRCLGEYVARVMIPEIVRRLLLRPGLKATSCIDYAGGPFPEHYQFQFDTR